MPSDLDRAIAQARRALLARESTATTALLDAWGLAWDVLARELAALTAEIAAARAAGEDVGLGTLYRSARYQSLMAQLADEVTRYSVSAEQRIAAAQRVAATAGWADAGSFIGAQGATLAGSFDVLPADALRELVGVLGDGSPLSSLLSQLGPQAAEATRAALVTGVALGQGPRQIAAAVRQATSMVPARAATIARQESLRAYRGASFRRWQADDLVVGWWWSSAQDRRTCAICWAKHGTEHSIDEPFASHVVLLVHRLLWDRLDPAFPQPSLQHRLGGRAVGLSLLTGARPATHTLERLPLPDARLVSKSRKAAAFFVAAASGKQAVRLGGGPDRHGGGDETCPNCGARHIEGARQRVLRLAGDVAGHDRGVGQVMLHALAGPSLGSRQRVPLRAAAPDASLGQEGAQPGMADVELARRILAGEAGAVRLDRVVNRRVRHFAGHVYNLETTEGWYTASNIITHNCRCVPVPLLAGDSPDVTPGTEAFAALDEDMQREILGPGKFDLYAAGDVTLDDLVAETYSARWGPGLREKSLRELAVSGEALAAD
jgi:SPP1 gp7 family putative phage head morphogenesis protein